MAVNSIVSLILRGEDQGATAVLDDTATATDGLVGSLGKLAAGGAALGTIAAVGAALYELASFAGAAESDLSDLQIRTGSTADEMAAFRGNILAVRAAGLGDDFETAAKAIGTVETVLGSTGEELERITSKVIVLDNVFETGLNVTVRATDIVMEAFGGTADRTLDIITKGLQATGDPAEDLLDSLIEYSSTLAAAGFEAEQFTDILADGLAAGARNTDDIADALREFSIKVVDGSEATRRGFATLGIDVAIVEEQLESGALTIAGVFDIVQNRLNDAEFATVANQAAIDLYGTKAEDVGLAVIQSLDRQINSLGDFENASQDAVDTFTSGFANSTAQADALIERMKLLAGDSILPVATASLERLVGLFEVSFELDRAVAELASVKDASHDAAAELVNLALDVDLVSVAAGGQREALTAANQALVILENTYNVAGHSISDVEQSIVAINIANDLLAGGFRGTGEELAAVTIGLLENSTATAEAAVLALSFSDVESIAALKTADRADQGERLAAVLDSVALAEVESAEATAKAAAAIEAAAAAEADRLVAIEASTAAINQLNDELSAGFISTLGALESEQELATLNDTIFETVAASGAGAVELAALAFALGDAGEEAITEALKFEILQQGLAALARSAAEDGQITAEEIQGIIEGANTLQRELDQQFTVAFASEGSEGVIATGERLVSDLEAVTAATFGITLTTNAAAVDLEFVGLVGKLDQVDEAVEATITADTTTATADILEVGNQLSTLSSSLYNVDIADNSTQIDENISFISADLNGLVAPIYGITLEDNSERIASDIATINGDLTGLTSEVYDIKFSDNSNEVATGLGTLTGALDGLNGSTYTFFVTADTSGVPPWAIPESPLPIAVAWENFLDLVNNTPIDPSLAGAGSLLPPTLSGEAVSAGGLGQLATAPTQGGGGNRLIINGNIIINDQNDPAAVALVEFLQDQIRISNNEGF